MHSNKKVSQRRDFNLHSCLLSKINPHGGGILTCAHMLPPSSQKKSSQREDFDLGLCASHHLKNNPPKGRIHKRWDKNLVQEILLIEGYLHVSTFYSGVGPGLGYTCYKHMAMGFCKPQICMVSRKKSCSK